MKALLLKDWLVTKKYLRMLLFMDLCFLVVGVFGMGSISFFAVFPMVMWTALVSSLISYDERFRFDKTCDQMPVSRKLQVSEKYLLGLLYAAAVFVICCIGVVRHYPAGSARSLMLAAVLGAGFVPASLMLPLIFKLGMEKGRVFYFVFYFGGILLSTVGADAASGAVLAFGPRELALCALLLAALYALSWRLSIRFYEKREL